MLSTIVSILIFVVPIGVFLAVQFFTQQGRQRSHWPQPKNADQAKAGSRTEGATGPRPAPARRKTRARPIGGPSCGREVTHLLLGVVGARNSCRHCADLRSGGGSHEPIDLLAEAERIAKEAQE